MHRATIALLAAWAFLPSEAAWAHSGGLNAEGCHNNRKTDEYHCHRAQAEPEKPANAAVGSSKGLSSGGLVKMSKSGICHDTTSPWYDQTKNFTAYQSMSACIN